MSFKVVCIKKPSEDYIKRNVSVNNIYDVILENDYDYKLYDDNGELWYFQKSHFRKLDYDFTEEVISKIKENELVESL